MARVSDKQRENCLGKLTAKREKSGASFHLCVRAFFDLRCTFGSPQVTSRDYCSGLITRMFSLYLDEWVEHNLAYPILVRALGSCNQTPHHRSEEGIVRVWPGLVGDLVLHTEHQSMETSRINEAM